MMYACILNLSTITWACNRFYGKGPYSLVWLSSRVAHVQIAVSGVLNRLNYFVTFIIYRFYKRGRGPHNTTWWTVGWVPVGCNLTNSHRRSFCQCLHTNIIPYRTCGNVCCLRHIPCASDSSDFIPITMGSLPPANIHRNFMSFSSKTWP